MKTLASCIRPPLEVTAQYKVGGSVRFGSRAHSPSMAGVVELSVRDAVPTNTRDAGGKPKYRCPDPDCRFFARWTGLAVHVSRKHADKSVRIRRFRLEASAGVLTVLRDRRSELRIT